MKISVQLCGPGEGPFVCSGMKTGSFTHQVGDTFTLLADPCKCTKKRMGSAFRIHPICFLLVYTSFGLCSIQCNSRGYCFGHMRLFFISFCISSLKDVGLLLLSSLWMPSLKSLLALQWFLFLQFCYYKHICICKVGVEFVQNMMSC